MTWLCEFSWIKFLGKGKFAFVNLFSAGSTTEYLNGKGFSCSRTVQTDGFLFGLTSSAAMSDVAFCKSNTSCNLVIVTRFRSSKVGSDWVH